MVKLLFRVIVKTTVREEYLIAADNQVQARKVFEDGNATNPVVRDVEDAWVEEVYPES